MDDQESHAEQTRRIGKDYWQNNAVSRRADNSEKLGFYPSENRSRQDKKRQSKQEKSHAECFASHTFRSFNKELINDYESRHPQPKEWKGRSRSL